MYVIFALMIVGTHGQGDDNWCESVPLPFSDASNDTANFAVVKPNWWTDYYSLTTTHNSTTVYVFKVYPGRSSDIAVLLYMKAGLCPQPQGATDPFDHLAYGMNTVVSVAIQIPLPIEIRFYVRAIGFNYSFVGGIQNAVVEFCPSDCNFRGYCDIASSKCYCHGGYDGLACEQKITPPKIPFGSWTIYYGVIIGVPVIAVALIAGLITIVILFRRRRADAHRYSKLPINAHIPINQNESDIQDLNIVQSR